MLVRIACVALLVGLGGCSSETGGGSHRAQAPGAETAGRTFQVHEIARVPGVTAGGSRLDVWLPVPQSDAQQRVSAVSIRTDLPYEMQTETDYGNAVLHAWTDRATAATIELIFSCTRLPEHGLPGTTTENVSKEPAPEARDLSPIAWA